MKDRQVCIQKIPIAQIIPDNSTLVWCPSIIVVHRTGSPSADTYELVNGRYELKEHIALGLTEVLAAVINPTPEECLAMRLLEPLPRRPLRRGHDRRPRPQQ